MNCFYHPTTVAVGICKSCQKALCTACAVDLGRGLACVDKCEEDVKALNEMLERGVKRVALNEHIYATARSNRYIGAMFYLASGSLFIGFSAYRYFQFETHDLFLFGIGLLFLIFGLVALQRAIRFPQAPK